MTPAWAHVSLSDQPLPDRWVALASPEPGVAMTSRVEAIARSVRTAVAATASALESPERYLTVFTPRVSGLGFDVAGDELLDRAARALVAEWLVAYSVGAVSATASLKDAEDWFYGGQRIERLAPRLPPLFEAPCTGEEVFALLPYLLDALRPGTRREVLRDTTAAADRRIRKQRGAFYTPADVAAQMAKWVAPEADDVCLDPTCGTGVFLRAAIAHGGLAPSSVFGCDLDPAAIDAATFVVLATALAYGWGFHSPWAGWHAVRLNLASLNSLSLELGGEPATKRLEEVRAVRRQLLSGAIPPPVVAQATSNELGQLFPSLAEGVDIVLSNPPYATIGEHARSLDAHQFLSLERVRLTSAIRAEALFSEYLWKLTKPASGRGSLVLPLSVATSTRPEFVGLRRAIKGQSGAWAFSFYDRAPDGLFGDDVKTRNTIVVYRAGRRSSIRTTPLLKWTSRTRRTFFATVTPTPIKADLVDCIPKLGSPADAQLYAAVRNLPGRLRDDLLVSHSEGPRSQVDFFEAVLVRSCVAVAPTAYNWIGVARDPRRLVADGHTSENTLCEVVFRDPEVADAAYAVLASRIVFWLWRVESDGFHVTRRFIQELPFRVGGISRKELLRLAELGRRLWDDVAGRAIWSVNKGRTSVGYPSHRSPLIDVVDEAVFEAFGLSMLAARCDVRGWHENVVVVDFSEHKRLARLAGGTHA
jgi:hypothetical protein